MTVYFAQRASDGLVKIGWSRHIDDRHASLERLIGEPLTRLRIVETDERQAERWCHDQFAHLRVEGEWFRYDGSMATIAVPDFPKPEPVERPSLSGDDIAILQKRLRLTRAQFARVLGISPSRVDDIKGTRKSGVGPTPLLDLVLEALKRLAEIGDD